MASESQSGDQDRGTVITASSDEDVARARVREKHDLVLDEPPWVPIGNDTAPCPGDYLLVAIAGCQVEQIKQCFQKARIDEYDIRVHAERHRERLDDRPEPYPGDMQTTYSDVTLDLEVETTEEFEGRVRRCLDVCEDACNVGRSVQAGIDVAIEKSLRVAPDA